MKIVKWMLFENRIGIYAFVRLYNEGIWVVYQKFSQPDAIFIVKASGKDLDENFFNAMAEVDNLLPLDIVVAALQLSVPISPQIAENLLNSQLFLEKISERFGIQEGII